MYISIPRIQKEWRGLPRLRVNLYASPRGDLLIKDTCIIPQSSRRAQGGGGGEFELELELENVGPWGITKEARKSAPLVFCSLRAVGYGLAGVRSLKSTKTLKNPAPVDGLPHVKNAVFCSSVLMFCSVGVPAASSASSVAPWAIP